METLSMVDFESLLELMKGSTVPRPLSGTLSGHAAGEPFDKAVYANLKRLYPSKIFRQYEYLNFLYTRHLDVVGAENREKLIRSPTLMFLLSRGKDATDKWSVDNPFEEKQNDTADILMVDGDRFDIIDVKTRNIAKSAQPPNIISAYKLAQTSAHMLDNEEFDNFTIDYFEVDWRLEGSLLVCKDTHHANLFAADPRSIYINWAAAMQIQFHVVDCDQSFTKNREDWAREYLLHFVSEARERTEYMRKKFVDPFLKYIE